MSRPSESTRNTAQQAIELAAGIGVRAWRAANPTFRDGDGLEQYYSTDWKPAAPQHTDAIHLLVDMARGRSHQL